MAQEEALQVPKYTDQEIEIVEVKTVAIVHVTITEPHEDTDSSVEATTAFLDATKTKETEIPPELPFDPGSLEVDINTKKELAIDAKNDDSIQGQRRKRKL